MPDYSGSVFKTRFSVTHTKSKPGMASNGAMLHTHIPTVKITMSIFERRELASKYAYRSR